MPCMGECDMVLIFLAALVGLAYFGETQGSGWGGAGQDIVLPVVEGEIGGVTLQETGSHSVGRAGTAGGNGKSSGRCPL